MRELQSTDLNETLRRHQSSFDQKTMNFESSKISKFVNRVNTEDESRWNKTVTNAYDLNLQQDKNMNETDAMRSALHLYNWDFSATDVILGTCTASSIQKDRFLSLESIFEDCSLLNASTCERRCWYWIFAWVSSNHCSSCRTEVSRFSEPCCSWDAFISQALSHNRSIYARERKFNTINRSWKASTWQFRSQNSDSTTLSQKRSECHILHRRSRVSVMLSRYREKEWSSCQAWSVHFSYKFQNDTVRLSWKHSSLMNLQHFSREIKEVYVRNTLLLCLNLLREFKSSLAQRLLYRDLNDWCWCILQCVKQLHMLSLSHHLSFINRCQIELQILSLLRELYCISDDIIANQQNRFNSDSTDLTSLNNLILYDLTCAAQTARSRQFNIADLCYLHKILFRFRLFVQVIDDRQIRWAKIFEVRKWILRLENSLSVTLSKLIRDVRLISATAH